MDSTGYAGELTGASTTWVCSAGLAEVVGGVVAGLLAALVLWGVRWVRNRRDFGRLAGRYRVTEKQSSTDEGIVELRGNGPMLRFTWQLADGTSAEGQLAMNEQSRVTGSGNYQHTRGTLGWGYVSVQVASRERGAVCVLVDGWYTKQEERQQIASAWVWEMTEGTSAR